MERLTDSTTVVVKSFTRHIDAVTEIRVTVRSDGTLDFRRWQNRDGEGFRPTAQGILFPDHMLGMVVAFLSHVDIARPRR